jgi:hypothetical protein
LTPIVSVASWKRELFVPLGSLNAADIVHLLRREPEARLAAKAETRKKAEAEEPVAKFSWTEAEERMMEELERRAADLGITG